MQNNKLCILMLPVKGFDKNCCSNLVTQIHVIMEKVCLFLTLLPMKLSNELVKDFLAF